jgi:hypothetical protein
MSSKTNKLMKLPIKIGNSKIDRVVASDFAGCLTNSGQLYLWGPTPLG